MRSIWVMLAALAALAQPALALAKPLSPGACLAIDDGVAALPRTAPFPIYAPLPQAPPALQKGPFETAVVDVSFRIGTDGRVESARVLCAKPENDAFAAALAAAMAGWRFEPLRVSALLLAGSRVAYRIVVTDTNQVDRQFLGVLGAD